MRRLYIHELGTLRRHGGGVVCLRRTGETVLRGSSAVRVFDARATATVANIVVGVGLFVTAGPPEPKDAPSGGRAVLVDHGDGRVAVLEQRGGVDRDETTEVLLGVAQRG